MPPAVTAELHPVTVWRAALLLPSHPAKSPCGLDILPTRNPAAGCEASLSSTLKAVGLESAPEGLKGVTKIAATACKVGGCMRHHAPCAQVVGIWRVCNRKPNVHARPCPAHPPCSSLPSPAEQPVRPMVSKHGALQRQLASYDKSRSQLVLNGGPQLEKTAVHWLLVCMIPSFPPHVFCFCVLLCK